MVRAGPPLTILSGTNPESKACFARTTVPCVPCRRAASWEVHKNSCGGARSREPEAVFRVPCLLRPQHRSHNAHRSLLVTTTTNLFNTTPAMSRVGNSRAPSPTYTTFSGISNYRQSSSANSFRKPGGGNVPPVPAVDGRLIARAHFEELSRYLAEYLARGQQTSY
jgi:hypothetical protein